MIAGHAVTGALAATPVALGDRATAHISGGGEFLQEGGAIGLDQTAAEESSISTRRTFLTRDLELLKYWNLERNDTQIS
jgi:hypothetical protein